MLTDGFGRVRASVHSYSSSFRRFLPHGLVGRTYGGGRQYRHSARHSWMPSFYAQEKTNNGDHVRLLYAEMPPC